MIIEILISGDTMSTQETEDAGTPNLPYPGLLKLNGAVSWHVFSSGCSAVKFCRWHLCSAVIAFMAVCNVNVEAMLEVKAADTVFWTALTVC